MRFLWLDSDRYILTNLAGNYQVIKRDQLDALVNHRIPLHSTLYDDLKANHFLADDDSTIYEELLAAKYRTRQDRKSTRLNSSHRCISYAVFCLKKKI